MVGSLIEFLFKLKYFCYSIPKRVMKENRIPIGKKRENLDKIKALQKSKLHLLLKLIIYIFFFY